MSDEWDHEDLHDEYEPGTEVDREIKRYRDLVPRTLLDRPEAPISDKDIMIIWNIVGLAGEAGEIAELIVDSPHRKDKKDKIADELGDAIWYIAALCEKLSLSFPKIVQLADREPFLYATGNSLALKLCVRIGKTVGIVKKGIFHRHGLDRDTLELELISCMTFILGIAAEYELQLTGILKGNIKKLERRYKDGFTSTESMNRKPGDQHGSIEQSRN